MLKKYYQGMKTGWLHLDWQESSGVTFELSGSWAWAPLYLLTSGQNFMEKVNSQTLLAVHVLESLQHKARPLKWGCRCGCGKQRCRQEGTHRHCKKPLNITLSNSKRQNWYDARLSLGVCQLFYLLYVSWRLDWERFLFPGTRYFQDLCKELDFYFHMLWCI